MKLTDAGVKKLSKPEKDQILYRDDSLPGFGVRVTPTKASYIVEARVNGRSRRSTICPIERISLTDARKRARKILADMSSGIDPVVVKKEKAAELAAKTAKAEMTFRKILEQFISSKGVKDSSENWYRTMCDRHLSELLNRSVLGITPAKVLDLHSRLKGSTTESQVDGAMRILRTLLKFAQATIRDAEGKPIMSSVATDVLREAKLFKKQKRKTSVLHSNQLKAWWNASDSLKNSTTRDLLRFLLLTGMRRNEGAKLEWSDVDLSSGTVTLKDTKGGRPLVFPMGQWLKDMMIARQDAADTDFVFPSPVTKEPMMDIRSAIEKMELNGSAHFTPHDLRRTFITTASSLDISTYAVKALVNHSQSGDVTAGYVHMDLEQLRSASQRIEDAILRSAGISTADVIDLGARRVS